MHIYFSGIGGGAIGPLALIAKQAGYTVSGSDKQESAYIAQLRDSGITNIHIGQSYEAIQAIHDQEPIDWYVYTSALVLENPNAPELQFCHDQNIKTSKRDELLNQILRDKDLKLIAVAGTHGKTTTTAIIVWLMQQAGLPFSYSVGGKIPFGPMGTYIEGSEYFVYECDEFDRNFLAFEPHLSLITGVSWDHHEIFPTREDYQEAFHEFIGQSAHTLLWQEDAEYLGNIPANSLEILDSSMPEISHITLPGQFNRLDGWLAIQAVHRITHIPINDLIAYINRFPGLKQRMEKLADNLYTNYAHTPEKIRGGMSTALEIAEQEHKDVVIIYEPLTNRRQYYIKDDYKDCFAGAKKLYWVPSYLAREDPDMPVLTPEQLIPHLADPSIAEPAKIDEHLRKAIEHHRQNGDIVVAMGASGGGSLDEWLRKHFSDH
jgi:UDP-N-acetylmuramate--alanine ligase